MFGHTQFSIGPQFPSHTIDGRKVSPTSRPQSPSSSQQVARRTTQSPLLDRFSNKSYGRAPSPVSRLQSRPATPSSGSSSGRSVRDVPKPRVATVTGFRNQNLAPSDKSPRLTGGIKNEKERVGPRQSSPVGSASDMARVKPLQEQCSLQPRPRPRTAGTQRDDDLDSRVMMAVKQALSRAVLERGPIYEHNIDTVMYDMKSRLRLADNDRVVGSIEKLSDTTIGSRKATPLAGIVRKDLGDSLKPTQSGYKPVYGGGLRRSPSNRVIDNDPDSIVFIDLPDPDSSNFNFLLNKERSQSTIRQKAYDFVDVGNKYSSIVTTPANIDLERDSEEDMSSYVEDRVGDGQPRSCRSFTIWKESDDTKLQRYISKLINNMNNKLRGDLPNEGVDRELDDEPGVCTSFCVCKVCLRNKQSKNEPNELKESIRIKPKPIDNGLKSSIGQTSSIRSNIGKSQPTPKDSKASTNVRVVKKAENLVFESTINPRRTLFSAPPPPHTVQTPEPEAEDEEAREEMYLRRRRMRSAPGKRN